MLFCLPLLLGHLPADNGQVALDWHTPVAHLPKSLQESPWSEQLSAALDVTRAAGRELLAARDLNLTPLENASVRSNDLIFRMLRSRFPSYGLVLTLDNQDLIWPANDLIWVASPLDDIEAFVSGSHRFSIQITLLDSEEPVLGVCYYPAFDFIYFTVSGYGTFMQFGSNPAMKCA